MFVCVCARPANALQGRAAGLQADSEAEPATSTPASFVWTRAVSGCRAAHDEVSVGNCPREASTSQGGMGGWWGGGWGRHGADRERNDTLGSSYSLSRSSSLPHFFLVCLPGRPAAAPPYERLPGARRRPAAPVELQPGAPAATLSVSVLLLYVCFVVVFLVRCEETPACVWLHPFVI